MFHKIIKLVLLVHIGTIATLVNVSSADLQISLVKLLDESCASAFMFGSRSSYTSHWMREVILLFSVLQPSINDFLLFFSDNVPDK